TPLKDRYGAQVRTHYPKNIEDEIAIMEMERRQFSVSEYEFYIPVFIKEIIALITHLARKSPDINQRSGVSVRVSIANYETVLSNSIRRAVTLGEKLAVPRISDFPYIHSSTSGKIELESFEETKEDKIIDDMVKKAVLNVFNRYYQLNKLEEIISQFSGGFGVEVSATMSAKSYVRLVKEMIGLTDIIKVVSDSENPEIIASAVEFILEGLHANKRLNKTKSEGKIVYRR
ncbi:magnesium chelatase, partial [Chloroflexota bacterium]